MQGLKEILKHNTTSFHKVINFDKNQTGQHIDLSKGNPTFTEEIFDDTQSFSKYIEDVKTSTNATFLFGGYNELREMYKRSVLFNLVKENNAVSSSLNLNETIIEPRRLHLGMDVWCKAGTKIFTPLGGLVHSFANNKNFGDYGPTIILQHQLNTVVFFTLYGHLSLKDIANIKIGQFITRGQCIAHVGDSFENGNWPPHLHFQIIEDLERREGDYPGVCKLSEKEKYLHNCPDPNLILNF